jgi:hypothetical protein
MEEEVAEVPAARVSKLTEENLKKSERIVENEQKVKKSKPASS